MKSKHLVAGILVAVLSAGAAWAVSPQIIVPLQFTNLSAPSSVAYGFGLDPNAKDGLDEDPHVFDTMAPPPPPFTPGNTAAFVVDALQLATDVRELRDGVDNYYWRLEIDIADPTNAATHVTMSWNTADVIAAGFDKAELRTAPSGGTLLKDMETQGSHLFGDDATVYIVLSNDPAPYFPPVAVDDGPISVFLGRSATIQVLKNDTGSNLSVAAVESPTTYGTAARVSNNQAVQYSAPAALAKPVGGWPAVDTFTYTITDGQQQATASITVNVYGEIFAERRHAPLAKTGDDGGLRLGVDLLFDPATIQNFIRYRETLPWRPASGTRSGQAVWAPSVDDQGNVIVTMLAGDPPDIATYDPNTFELVLQWNLTPSRNVGEIKFDVDLVNSDPSATGDTSFEQGQIEYEDDTGAPVTFDMENTNFQARLQLFHSADYTDEDGTGGPDWKIDIGELQRVLFLYNNGGYYAPDASAPDGFNRSAVQPGLASGYHSADYTDEDGTGGPDWKIDIGELQRVLFLYNNGGYYATDTDAPDGYNRSATQPTR